MNYNYCINLQGFIDGKWIQIECNSFVGTYGSGGNHYFYTCIHDLNHSNTVYCQHPDDSHQYTEECHYIFSFETIEEDYMKHISDYNLVPHNDQLKEMIMNDDISIDTLIQIRDVLNTVISTHDDVFRDELEHYYLRCCELYDNYDDVRIVFGITP